MCMKGKIFKRTLAVILAVAMSSQSIYAYAADAIRNTKYEESNSKNGAIVLEGETKGEEENNTVHVQTAYALNKFTYEELNGSYIAITGYTGEEKNIEIPESIDGFIVQKIANGAFQDTDIESVKIPDSVEVLGDDAFKRCKALKTIDLGHVKTIGGSTFSECHSLKELIFPEGLTSIGGWGANNCTALVRIVLPDSLTTISRNAFSGCTNLESINYPMSLKMPEKGSLKGITS